MRAKTKGARRDGQADDAVAEAPTNGVAEAPKQQEGREGGGRFAMGNAGGLGTRTRARWRRTGGRCTGR